MESRPAFLGLPPGFPALLTAVSFSEAVHRKHQTSWALHTIGVTAEASVSGACLVSPCSSGGRNRLNTRWLFKNLLAAVVHPLFRGGSRGCLVDYRILGLNWIRFKMMKMIAVRLLNLQCNQLLRDEKYGFRQHRPCVTDPPLICKLWGTPKTDGLSVCLCKWGIYQGFSWFAAWETSGRWGKCPLLNYIRHFLIGGNFSEWVWQQNSQPLLTPIEAPHGPLDLECFMQKMPVPGWCILVWQCFREFWWRWGKGAKRNTIWLIARLRGIGYKARLCILHCLPMFYWRLRGNLICLWQIRLGDIEPTILTELSFCRRD